MKMNNKLIILITLLVSTSYIFGIDYYDRKETKVRTLYEKIALPDITYTEISSTLRGIKEKEELKERDLALKHNQVVHEFAHEYSCSRLCTQVHPVHCESEFIQEEEAMEIRVTGSETETPYSLSIRNQKDLHYNTHYKIMIQGLEDINQIDHLRNRSLQLFKNWGVKAQETLYFKGVMRGEKDKGERKAIVNTVLNQLKAKKTGYYQDDVHQDTEAYYAYTKFIKDYVLDQDNTKSNIQISFSYNEIQGETQIIIALPFYNESF
ncbi:YwmB family TATA-box binding protein [Cellulosilyticum sp. I15G10I2]|uniref:YwmB family TATA-box binding protein n=1 Tax=Cellulosilyticum sp. I15G10I2 TaxID=1892843 RepID=UPI00085C595C|nr:YwmB family TATA-box binding protein [Cellulosilyticum sp. I15G10I2]